MLKRRTTSILVHMQSSPGKMPRVLAAAVMAAVFSCQVIGSMCMMAPLAVAATPAVHQAHAGHLMGEGNPCAVSLPSSPKPVGSFDPHAASLVDSFASPFDAQHAVFGNVQVAPFSREAGPLLYLRLLTFRI